MLLSGFSTDQNKAELVNLLFRTQFEEVKHMLL